MVDQFDINGMTDTLLYYAYHKTSNTKSTLRKILKYTGQYLQRGRWYISNDLFSTNHACSNVQMSVHFLYCILHRTNTYYTPNVHFARECETVHEVGFCVCATLCAKSSEAR